MSLDYTDWQKLKEIKADTAKTVLALNDASIKMDRQIALLERIVRILESRADDGR